MKALIQRVKSASVTLSGGEKREIGPGLAVLLGVGKNDNSETARKLADKTAALRIFSNAEGKFDLSLLDVKGQALVISQFTLYGDCSGGRRPDFTAAARPEAAEPLYREYVEQLRRAGLDAVTGEFADHMLVEIANDGPVTVLLEVAPL